MTYVLKIDGPLKTKDTHYYNGKFYFSLAATAKENADRLVSIGMQIDVDNHVKTKVKTFSLWKQYLRKNIDYIIVGGRSFVTQYVFDYFASMVGKNEASAYLGISRQTLGKLIRERYVAEVMAPSRKTKYVSLTSLADQRVKDRVDKGLQLGNLKPRTTVPVSEPWRYVKRHEKQPKPEKSLGSKPSEEAWQKTIDEKVSTPKKHENPFISMSIDDHLRNIERLHTDFTKADPLYLNSLEDFFLDYTHHKHEPHTQLEKSFYPALDKFNRREIEEAVIIFTEYLGKIKLSRQEIKRVQLFFSKFYGLFRNLSARQIDNQ